MANNITADVEVVMDPAFLTVGVIADRVGRLIHKLNQGAEDVKTKERAVELGDDYYHGNDGCLHLTSNNHKIVMQTYIEKYDNHNCKFWLPGIEEGDCYYYDMVLKHPIKNASRIARIEELAKGNGDVAVVPCLYDKVYTPKDNNLFDKNAPRYVCGAKFLDKESNKIVVERELDGMPVYMDLDGNIIRINHKKFNDMKTNWRSSIDSFVEYYEKDLEVYQRIFKDMLKIHKYEGFVYNGDPLYHVWFDEREKIY